MGSSQTQKDNEGASYENLPGDFPHEPSLRLLVLVESNATRLDPHQKYGPEIASEGAGRFDVWHFKCTIRSKPQIRLKLRTFGNRQNNIGQNAAFGEWLIFSNCKGNDERPTIEIKKSLHFFLLLHPPLEIILPD